MMKQLCATLLVLIPFSVLAQTAPDPGQAQKVTDEELKKLIPGATMRGDDGKFIFRHTYKADGTLEGGSSYSGGQGTERAWDTGRWRIDGDKLCKKFQKWDNQESCREIERVADGQFRYVGRNYTVTIK